MDLEEPKLFLRRMKLQSYRSNGMEWKSPEIYPYIHGQLIFDKGAKYSSTGKKKKKSFQQTVLNNQIIHLPKLQQQNLRTLSNTAAATAAKSLQSFCFSLLFFSQLFVRPPQTAILLFCISFPWGWS